MSDGDHVSEPGVGVAVADAVVSVRVNVEPRRVWAEFCEAEALQTWFWPPRFETAAASDPVVGGTWNVRSAPMAMAAAGRYLVVDRPRFLRMSWAWDGEAEVSTVTIALEPAGKASDGAGGTIVTVRHSGHSNEVARANHERGWRDCLARLVGRHR